MSEIITATELLQSTQPDNVNATAFKLATVTDKFNNGNAKITFDGESKASEKKYAYLSSYSPNIGDRVLLGAVRGTYVIVGKIKYDC